MRFITIIQYHLAKKHDAFPVVYNTTRQFRSFRTSGKTTLPNVPVDTEVVRFGRLWKPFGFTVLFSGVTIVGAAICEYERIRAQAYRIINHYRPPRLQRTGWRHEVEIWWRSLSDGQRLFVPICFLNVLVFLAWRVPSFQNSMMQYFCTGPTSSVTISMILSTFSHYSALHLIANMFVLQTFSTSAVALLGREQFMALYLSSGVVSSFASFLYKSVTGRPGLSLGASGAILGILSFLCMQYPEGRLSIIFLPMITFPAGMALKALMGIDLTGCILGWRYFDHAAHLGGAMWGIFWQQWGSANIWQKREPIVTYWDSIRDPRRSH